MAKKQLIDSIVEKSINKHWVEAKKEWQVVDIYYLGRDESGEQEFEECLCGQSNIVQVCKIENTETNERVVIGNKCVNEFLGQDYSHLFRSLQKITKDIDKSVSGDTILYAFQSGWITESSKNFYLDISNKRILSSKQLQWKQKINSIIKNKLTRKDTKR